MKKFLPVLVFTLFAINGQSAFAAENDSERKADAIEIADIDRAVRKLRLAICALKNDATMLTKARYTLAVKEERDRIAEMKAALEAEGRSSELRHLESAVANAETAGAC